MDDILEVYGTYARESLLPLCRDAFADTLHGGFHEQLDAAFRPVPGLGKRLLVQCRQLYVMSHAAVLGDPSGGDAAERGLAFLLDAFRDGRNGGWFFRTTAEGAVADRTKDLYGHAFVLLALAWIHRAFRDPRALDLAAWTLDVLKSRMASPHGGYVEAADAAWQPLAATRRQNPHMHLVEALLDLYEASGDRRWLDEAAPLLGLLQSRFVDPETGTLGEFFTDDWRSHPEEGAIVEPGHHYEWVWLLLRHDALTAPLAAGGAADPARERRLALAEGLFAFAERHGSGPILGIHDQLDRAGRPLQRTRRIWPVAEAIKATLLRDLRTGPATGSAAPTERLVAHLLADFVPPQRRGSPHRGWIERLSADGRPAGTTLPGSTPYHLFLAAAEVERYRQAHQARMGAAGAAGLSG